MLGMLGVVFVSYFSDIQSRDYFKETTMVGLDKAVPASTVASKTRVQQLIQKDAGQVLSRARRVVGKLFISIDLVVLDKFSEANQGILGK